MFMNRVETFESLESFINIFLKLWMSRLMNQTYFILVWVQCQSCTHSHCNHCTNESGELNFDILDSFVFKISWVLMSSEKKNDSFLKSASHT